MSILDSDAETSIKDEATQQIQNQIVPDNDEFESVDIKSNFVAGNDDSFLEEGTSFPSELLYLANSLVLPLDKRNGAFQLMRLWHMQLSEGHLRDRFASLPELVRLRLYMKNFAIDSDHIFCDEISSSTFEGYSQELGSYFVIHNVAKSIAMKTIFRKPEWYEESHVDLNETEGLIKTKRFGLLENMARNVYESNEDFLKDLDMGRTSIKVQIS